jgi:hypothetical protein
MASPRLTRLLIEAMAKHLPPSAASLRLLDIGGAAHSVLQETRADLDVQTVQGPPDSWPIDAESVDAVVAYDHPLAGETLAAALRALRPGGRLIAVDSGSEPGESAVRTLEQAGYTRILVETAAECPTPVGVLMRGEKPHITSDTLERIQVAAGQDADSLNLSELTGRYVHLLVIQSPNMPVWKLEPGQTYRWDAIAAEQGGIPHLLAFTSLPKAVGFMQPAVMAGRIADVNKVAKFSKATAQTWAYPVLVNPTLDSLYELRVARIEIDPETAEAPDE